MATPAPKEQEQATPPKSRRPGVITLALIALGLSATAAGGAYYFTTRNSAHVEKPVVVEEPIFLPLEPLTVNLQPNGRNRFLHVAMTLKIADAKTKEQITQYLPEVRSRMLTVLSNRSGETLLSGEDKSRLAGEIMAALNQPFAPNLPAQKITSVMFTTFMLQ